MMFVVGIISLAFVSPGLRLGCGARHPGVSVGSAWMCDTSPPSLELKNPEDMRLKELKEELDSLGVSWRGVVFERSDLERELLAARSAPPPSPAKASDSDEPEQPAVSEEAGGGGGGDGSGTVDSAESSASYDAAYKDALERAMGMKARQLRTELHGRGLEWADLYEKEELASRLAAACAKASVWSATGAMEPGKVSPLGADEARREMLDARSPMVVDLYATWCGPCKMIAPMLEKEAARLGEAVRFAKVDSDAEPELSTELGVQGLPTILFMREGREVYRLEGAPPNSQAIGALIAEHCGV